MIDVLCTFHLIKMCTYVHVLSLNFKPFYMQKKSCLTVLRLLLDFTTVDPLILQCQFRCLQSGLVNFLHLDPEVFNVYVKKVMTNSYHVRICIHLSKSI